MFSILSISDSKAIHNMKIEQAKEQNTNENLKRQLSSSKLITEETYKNKNDYFIRMKELLKERLEIISQIKQLELNSVGDSNLLLENCTINDIILSLDRIHKFINDKNTYLENTLTNVQASYQLLKSKADEAKIIAEEERQKIINEKIEIHRERKIIEEQLENLNNENLNYEKIIQNLQGEIMNQSLVFNRHKQLNENDIIKLREQNTSLQDLYNKSLYTIKELQENLDAEFKYKNFQFDEIEKLKLAVEQKNKEIVELQSYIKIIKNKPSQHFSAQTFSSNEDVEIQTDTQNEFSNFINNNNSITTTTSTENAPELLKSLNTINVEPTLDFIKHTYINYKVKNLKVGRLEHYSITDFHQISDDYNEHKLFQNDFYVTSPTSDNLNSSFKNGSIIDICSTQICTNSTKNLSDIDNHTNKNNTETLKSHSVIDPEKYNKVSEFKRNITLNESVSSTDNDMFLIYKESQSICDDETNIGNRSWAQNGFNMIVERATIYTNETLLTKRPKAIQNINDQSDYEENDDDSLKPKLNINMPTVLMESSATALSDDDVLSLDSYNKTFYNSPKWDIFSDTKINSKFSNNGYTATNHNVNNDKKLKTDQIIISKNRPHSKQKRKKIIENKLNHSSINADTKQVLRTQSPTESILSCTNPTVAVTQNIQYDNTGESNHIKNNYGLNYILNSIQNNVDLNNQQKLESKDLIALRKSHSEKKMSDFSGILQQSKLTSALKNVPTEYLTTNFMTKPTKSVVNRGILVKLDIVEEYENKIQQLTNALENMEKDYKKKLETIKVQYESNIKHIVKEHNQGVESIQNLHEDVIREIISKHENEVESLRTMSIEAMRKAEKLENENRRFKSTLSNNDNILLDEVPVKILTFQEKKKRNKTRQENKVLTKTIIDAFNVKPKRRSHGPCTCSIDINISDTIRNIFEQVDVEQRQMAETAYLKYIANKICNDNVDVLDAQELSFLHLKVCRTWKARLNKEESLQKKINSLENELINKQQKTQKNITDLDRKVAEEWRRLQEVREAVCRGHRSPSRECSSEQILKPAAVKKDVCHCNSISCNIGVKEIRYAGDLESKQICETKSKRGKLECNRVTLTKLDIDQRREKNLFNDETPTRLKRSHDRQYTRTTKK
ncbi:unnamed protein product [Euphydryas editha]|uniref:Uncharacterized protein n=1 Tax=Euphydryas editha TaxID=104508 RepID=A0AAU9V407_EUPED|nr:unnamed protein product [Euphydryas editha]